MANNVYVPLDESYWTSLSKVLTNEMVNVTINVMNIYVTKSPLTLLQIIDAVHGGT